MAKKKINRESMLRTGMVLHDNFLIDSYLASGGFGNTYVVTHKVFGYRRAIKEFFLNKVTERDSDRVQVKVSNSGNVKEFESQLKKFLKEAERLNCLLNEHIVRVYDCFEANGTAYYVMDFIDGENLAELLERQGKPIPEEKVEDYLRQILDALQEVHSNDILHMDLKPANIMLDRNGTVKLIDFGASKQADPEGGITSTAIAYTPGYAPLEQTDKQKKKFGPWTDFYALGATLYNLLTNKVPPVPSDIMDDKTPDKSKALPMPGVSGKMRRLVLWLMEIEREKRPQSVSQILNYLNQTEGELDDVDDETKLDDVKPQKNNKTLLWVCVSALLAGGGLGWMASRYNGEAEPVEEVLEDTSVAVEEAPPVVQMVANKAMTLPEGECVYSGQVNAEGLPDGSGKASFNNGDVCEGTFVNGKIDGDSIKYAFSDGDVFMGTLKNGSLVNGKYTDHKSGSYFIGSFNDNQPSVGKWYNKNGTFIKSIGESQAVD